MPSLFMLNLLEVMAGETEAAALPPSLSPLTPSVTSPNLDSTLKVWAILLQQVWKSLISLILVWNATIIIIFAGKLSPPRSGRLRCPEGPGDRIVRGENQLTCWHVCIIASVVITQFQILLLSQSAMAGCDTRQQSGKPQTGDTGANTLQGVDVQKVKYQNTLIRSWERVSFPRF